MKRYLRPETRTDRARRRLSCAWAALAFWWHQARCRHHYDLAHVDCRWYWECRHCHKEVEIVNAH
jgi:hypothetical protein